MKNQFSIKNKVCIVTGAGKGFGRAIAQLFYNEGAKLSLITRNIQDLLTLKDEIGYDANRVLLYEGDVSDEVTVKTFVSETISKFNRIDILINNAGIRFRKAFLDTSLSEWNKVLDANLGSVYLMCREVGRCMVMGKSGRIINIASIVGNLGLPELAAYGASKGGMITLTKCLALEWAEYNISVNAIAPGFCETSYADKFRKNTKLYNFTLERTPQKRWGTANDVANACLFLSSGASSYITGETLNVDGGWSSW